MRELLTLKHNWKVSTNSITCSIAVLGGDNEIVLTTQTQFELQTGCGGVHSTAGATGGITVQRWGYSDDIAGDDTSLYGFPLQGELPGVHS